MSRNKDARDKLIQEKLKQILDDLLRSEDNRYCADCNSKGKHEGSEVPELQDVVGRYLCLNPWTKMVHFLGGNPFRG